jgi:multidrug efflux pump subunit AcrA (membrane-fusion protein)
MSDLEQPPLLKGPPPRPGLPAPERETPEAPPAGPTKRGGSGRWLRGIGVLLLFVTALGLGVWRHYRQYRQVMDTAEQQADFVPTVRVADVGQHFGRVDVTLPATTLGFEAANIYARASGYVAKRYVDIGDHVKTGEVLAEIAAPEVEDQIAQYQNSGAAGQATTLQNQAQRALDRVTWARDAVLVKQGWVTLQQGDVDAYTLQAQHHATNAAHYNAAATQAQLDYYNHQKAYLQVEAPFDGVITQHNIDVGSLITADASGGTAMFSMTQNDVIRVSSGGSSRTVDEPATSSAGSVRLQATASHGDGARWTPILTERTASTGKPHCSTATTRRAQLTPKRRLNSAVSACCCAGGSSWPTVFRSSSARARLISCSRFWRPTARS